MNKNGFTLAEVLITLVIIGIIAAITVPTLMQRQNDYKFRAGLLKNYTVLTQAFRLAYGYNYDDFEEWDYAHSTTFINTVFQKIEKYLSVAKVCKNGSSMESCWADKIYAKNGQYAQWFTNNGKYTGGEAYSIVLNDGTSIIMDIWAQGTVTDMGVTNNLINPNANLGFWVDVNGKRKPNTIGKDVFAFVLTKKGIVPTGIDDNSVNCNNMSTNKNWDCTALVIKSQD